MDITPASTAATAAATKTTDAADSKSGIAGDFETFLTLLTTQLRNQDPLKPMESTEFVSQLATFSGVEQQVRANDRLDRIVEVLSGGTSDGLAAWIGKEVRAPGKGAFDGTPLDVEVTPQTGADKAVLVVKNDFDQIVARQPVAPADDLVTWDGTDGLGNRAANGRYSFELQSYEGETLLDTEPGRVFSTVNEVRLADGAPMLVLEDGTQVALADVTGLR